MMARNVCKESNKNQKLSTIATTDDGVTPESTIVSDTHNISGLYSVSSFYNFFNLIYSLTSHETSF